MKGLKLRGNVWWLHVRVPKDLIPAYGRTVSRSLKTHSRLEAERRLHDAMADLQDEWRRLRAEPDWRLPGPVATARRAAAELRAGRATVEDAEDALAFEALYDSGGTGIVDGPEWDEARRIVEAEAAPTVRLSTALQRHLDALQRTATPGTLKARRRAVEHFIQTVGDRPLPLLTKADVGDYVTGPLSRMGLKVPSMVQRHKALTAWLNWCVHAGLIERSPAEGSARLLPRSHRGRRDPDTRRPWTDAELRRLLANLDDALLRRAVLLALYTGCRVGELCRLRGADIVDGCLDLAEGKTESSVRMVPIHSAVAPMLAGIGEYVLPFKTKGANRGDYISARFSDVKTALGFDKGLTFHTLRNSFIAKLENAGVPVNITESIVGHRRQSMSYGVYSKGADMEVLREAIEKVSYANLP